MLRHGEEARCELEPRACSVAAPRPFLGRTAQAGPHRVQDDVTSGLEEMLLVLDQLGPEPVPKEVLSLPPMATIGKACKRPIQELHPGREPAELELNEQVVVVRHQAVGVACPVEARARKGEQLQQDLALEIVGKDLAAAIPLRAHVVDPAGDLDPGFPRHETKLRMAAGRRPWAFHLFHRDVALSRRCLTPGLDAGNLPKADESRCGFAPLCGELAPALAQLGAGKQCPGGMKSALGDVEGGLPQRADRLEIEWLLRRRPELVRPLESTTRVTRRDPRSNRHRSVSIERPAGLRIRTS
jgi:hypothetical protein